MDWQARFERLVAAVRAYDQALRRHGPLGTPWVESGQLDALYDAVLRAAGLKPSEPEDN